MHMTFHQPFRREFVHHDMIQAAPIAPEAVRAFSSVRADGVLGDFYEAMLGELSLIHI